MIGFGSPALNRRYDAWRTMSRDDYYDAIWGRDDCEEVEESDRPEEDEA